MGVVDALLVVNHDRLGHPFGPMVIVGHHGEKMPRVRTGGSAVNKKRLPGRRGVNGERMVLGGVGAETTGVFGAELRALAKVEPDAFVAIDRARGCLIREGFLSRGDAQGREKGKGAGADPGAERILHGV